MISTKKLLDYAKRERRLVVERRQHARLVDVTSVMVQLQDERIVELEREISLLKLKQRYGKVA